jgi:hypothetical protein
MAAATLEAIVDAAADQIRTFLDEVTDIAIHVEPGFFRSAELPAINVFPGAPAGSQGVEMAGYGELYGARPLTIRVIVSPPTSKPASRSSGRSSTTSALSRSSPRSTATHRSAESRAMSSGASGARYATSARPTRTDASSVPSCRSSSRRRTREPRSPCRHGVDPRARPVHARSGRVARSAVRPARTLPQRVRAPARAGQVRERRGADEG